MNNNVTFAVVLVLVAALVVAPVAAAAPSDGPAATYEAQDTETPTPEADSNASVQPGERLSGVVSVQQAELEGEVAERTYGVQVAQAATEDAEADVVAEQLADVEQRIESLEQRKQTLEDARENGSLSEGEYRAEIATVAVELATATELANASERTAESLPAALLSEKGINVTAIQTLKNDAENLSGPEVAAIAQSIAGADVGTSMAGAQTPEDVGAQIPDDAGAPDGTDDGAPNGTDQGAPNGTDDGDRDGADDGDRDSTDGQP